MIRSWLVWFLIGPLISISSIAVADDLSSAAASASVCSGCHAAGTTYVPRIDGLSESEIAESLRTARTSEDLTVMNRLARGLSDQEIDAIAAFLSRSE